jgi:RND family efflux transporter MFP subunit
MTYPAWRKSVANKRGNAVLCPAPCWTISAPAGVMGVTAAVLLCGAPFAISGCSRTNTEGGAARIAEVAPVVGVRPVTRESISIRLTLSSEFVPFQEIDVFAKESGFVKELMVDYGTRVQKDQLMAVLEIPELEMLLRQDEAVVKSAQDQVNRANSEVRRLEAQHEVERLRYERLKGVAERQPGLVAQQEVDDAHGRALASQAQVEAGKSNALAAQSQLEAAVAKLRHDQAIFDYTQIRAPFAGVVTQRYANYGTLMSAGTNSSTQALPLVRLSEDDKFRLVIPVPEPQVKYVHIGAPVRVRVPSLDKMFPGKVTRFSVDVTMETRTMHTEVDVMNPKRILYPGMYAEATLILESRPGALVAPVQAVSQTGNEATVLVIDDHNRVVERKVVPGLQTPSEVEVVEGLKEGERVVVSDRGGLKPGMLVRPVEVESMKIPAETQ